MTGKYLFLLVIVFISNRALEANCDRSCKEQLVRAYFDRLEVVYRESSAVEDIDALFQVFHRDVRYEHVEYQADFNFGAWREAFVSNLNRGAYNNGPDDGIRITKIINGKSHMAAEYGYGKIDEDGHWLPGESTDLLILFGFKDGKISLVREYW